MDQVIEGKAFINNAFEQCCVGIENGKIIEIKKILNCDNKLDFGKLFENCKITKITTNKNITIIPSPISLSHPPCTLLLFLGTFS